MEQSEHILEFWFGALTTGDAIDEAKHGMWFKKLEATDNTIRGHFGGDVAQALAGTLDGWAATPRGTLALIILLDQFTRNIFRDTPQSFAGDTRARAAALGALDLGVENALRPIERVFLVMPLMHSEDAAIQQRAVETFERIRGTAPEALQSIFADFLDSARRHRDIIGRFGRFPHRNAILGRASTPEEKTFLAEPGSSF